MGYDWLPNIIWIQPPKITHPFDVKVIFGVVKRGQNEDKNESENENNQNVSPS